ncbi:glycoside hydrolase family 26 protein [Microvirga subterranea]|uniref:Beta-mannanase n=1 Tax=Microvirga subterranea TaxID=186651 RepID=A0A370H3G5_9HYPH|nr:glycosyl hydrolase [Microvirga subterranea]RDI50227.1 beta-mannanase [Microvirga subterranea]
MRLEFSLVALACVLAAANMEWSSAQADGAPGLPKLGVYDPHRLLKDEKNIGIEHTFVYWQQFDPEQYRAFAAGAARRSRDIMVTVEPWTRADNWKDGHSTLLSDVLSGGFDKEIKTVCQAIGASKVPSMVSWGHEMDETEGRFPWANQDPETYQKAYRYFVDQCRPLAPNARFGWTPKGEQNLGAYYPGDTYVEFVGLTLFDVQAWNRDHGDRRTFEEKFSALHTRVAGYGKPIVLAEFGVEGDDDYREAWLSCAQERIGKFANMEAIVYFNARETWRWPKSYGQPDWRITDGDFFRCKPKAVSALTPDDLSGRTVKADTPAE